MPINKSALTRYHILDDCLVNTGRNYTKLQLLEIVNERLKEINPDLKGIKGRQFDKDIAFMRSAEGFDAPILAEKKGDKFCYFYEDPKFSIRKRQVNAEEAKQLVAALKVMLRFEGLPQFDWVGEITTRMKDEFSLADNPQKVISYETNHFYLGRRYIPELFNAIINKKILNVGYKPFNEPLAIITFHPYFLRQFNNRWFVLGYNQDEKVETWNLALDRIEKIEDTQKSQKPSEIDWEDHFDEIVGVTRPKGEPEEVKLIFSPEQALYIQTKPLHPTQKTETDDEGRLHLRIKVIPNYELEMLILSFGEKVEVVAPKSLKTCIANRVRKMAEQY
jgi:predicted DNA-binding transcriptional regulator YafY